VLLQVEHAVVTLGGRRALNDVDLSLHEGETVAVLGPSGSGKTTLLRTIAGLQSLDGGRICCDGTDLAHVAPHERRFGLMFQEYALFPHRDVAGNVEFGLRVTLRDGEERARRVDEMLELVGLSELRHRRIATLSGGEQQRVALARALVSNPQVLLLDEPLSNLDARLREEMRFELREMQARLGITSIFVTHDQAEAMTLSDRIVVMNAGRIEQAGAPRDVFNAPKTAFVAQFIGGHNVIATERGPIAVRADRLKLTLPATHSPSKLSATVRSVEYQGTHLQITLAAPDATELTATLSEAEYDATPVNPGEAAAVDWSDRDVHRLS
jgi:putative spermidine/putrescine transport system ATP-binding protein